MVKKHHPHPSPAREEEARIQAAAQGEGAPAPEREPGPAPAAEVPGAAPDAAEALRAAEQEAAEWKDRCLRAAAEFENYKKRQIRERGETAGRAQAEVVARVLDVLDDLARVAALDPAQTTAQALHEGAGLVERKLLKALEGVGVERVDPTGQPFDPNLHEAVMTTPAPGPEADHVIAAVLQPGYRLNGTLVRPARVAVYTWTPPAGAPAAP